MFVDSKVAVHLFSQEVIALAVLAREVFNQPFRSSSKNVFATAIFEVENRLKYHIPKAKIWPLRTHFYCLF
jgi:hypothetical protein